MNSVMVCVSRGDSLVCEEGRNGPLRERCAQAVEGESLL